MTKAQHISNEIAGYLGRGFHLPEAFNAVLGEGAYEAFVSTLYDELRKKAGVK